MCVYLITFQSTVVKFGGLKQEQENAGTDGGILYSDKNIFIQFYNHISLLQVL